MKKQCTKCKEFKALDNFHRNRLLKDGLHSWCKKCNNKHKSFVPPERNRAKLKRYTSKPGNSIKLKARERFRQAVSSGRITRKPCEICGEIKSQGHHDDYSKPLEVKWLCKKHHTEAHYGVSVLETLTL